MNGGGAVPAEPGIFCRWWWPAVAAAVATVLADLTGLDLAVARRLYDVEAHAWRWGESWWANALVHDGGRWLVAAVFLGSLGVLAVALVRRRRGWAVLGGYVALSIALTTALVALGKHVSGVPCPREWQEFGGSARPQPLLSLRDEAVPGGGCFPGGHSSGAFALLALYFPLRRRRPRAARAVLVAVLVLGALYALGQWVRGAHVPSHDLASLAVAWTVCGGLWELGFCRWVRD